MIKANTKYQEWKHKDRRNCEFKTIKARGIKGVEAQDEKLQLDWINGMNWILLNTVYD